MASCYIGHRPPLWEIFLVLAFVLDRDVTSFMFFGHGNRVSQLEAQSFINEFGPATLYIAGYLT